MSSRTWGVVRVVGAVAAGGLVGVGLAAAMLAPPDALQGNLQRLMYVHVPAAWLAYLRSR
jgi:heme exporter protein C